MSTLKPLSLRIFVADDDPDGLCVAERSNRVGKRQPIRTYALFFAIVLNIQLGFE